MLAQSATQPTETTVSPAKSTQEAERSDPRARPEYVVAGYGGAPYIHPSDVTFSKPGATDLTAHGVHWEGRPFKSPIYYGIRTIRWGGAGVLGGMLDFTHSKAIALRAQELRFSGMRNGRPMPDGATVGGTFRHFEFSHGHNTLTVNGLLRLADLLPGLAPYLGAGVGVALPHTEIQFLEDSERTYEYQYVGPAAQALIGMELKLPRLSLFIEYKFTVASYEALLTNRSGGWFPGDFWRQIQGYWRGETPAGGRLATILSSHQVASGVGVRFATVRPKP